MKVAIIKPYFNTPEEWLHKCHLSVKAQTYPCTHFIVADGQPYDDVDSCKWVRLALLRYLFVDRPINLIGCCRYIPQERSANSSSQGTYAG